MAAATAEANAATTVQAQARRKLAAKTLAEAKAKQAAAAQATTSARAKLEVMEAAAKAGAVQIPARSLSKDEEAVASSDNPLAKCLGGVCKCMPGQG